MSLRKALSSYSARGLKVLNLRQLEWAAVWAPMLFLGVYYYLMLGPLHPFFHSWRGFILLLLSLTGAVWLFSRTVFGAIRDMQAQIEELHERTRSHNEQLVALHGTNLALARETNVDSVLQRVVTLSAQLAGARRSALAVVDEHRDVTRVLTESVTEEQLRWLNGPPDGNSLIARLLRRPDARLRIDNLREYAPDGGAPQGEPGMSTFLGVPVVHLGVVLGALCLADRADGQPFTELDEEIVGMFAAHAAAVIENARLNDELQALAVERERQHIAREMHDGLAQVLSFVNTKAQAAEQFLHRGDTESARRHLAELSQAARTVYADIREGIVALRVQVGEGRDLRAVVEDYVEEFQQFSRLQVATVWDIDGADLRLTPSVEVQVLRIVQEALTNVRRHARARSVQVTFTLREGTLEVSVVDDGRGFDPARTARGTWPQFGLRSMRERAEAAGGTLEIESTVGAGTAVRASFPGVMREAGATA